MTLTANTTVPLTLAQVQTEFGGANPIGLAEYYAGGSYTQAGATGTYGAVPSTGTISIKNFYGTTKVVSTPTFNLTIAANTYNYNIHNAAVSAGWNGSAVVIVNVTVNASVYVGSSSTGGYAIETGTFTSGSTVTIINNGYIEGAGGNGGQFTTGSIASVGTQGGTAIHLSYPVRIKNNAGFLFGGGGGGSAGMGGAGGGGGGFAVGIGASGGALAAYPQFNAANGAASGYGGSGGVVGGSGGAGGGPNAVGQGGRWTNYYTGDGGSSGNQYSGGGGGGGGGAAGGEGGAWSSYQSDGGGSTYGSSGRGGVGSAPGAAGLAISKSGNAITWYDTTVGDGGATSQSRVYGAVV